MKNIFFAALILGMMLHERTSADEGMWLPSLIEKLNISEMRQMGCELDADDIYHINQSSLKDAVVALDRGSCTGELVSADGLLLTNHHCGFGEIQAHSSVEHDYLRDGFWAQSWQEELPNPGKTASLLVRMEDVTDRILDSLKRPVNEEGLDIRIQRAAFEIQKEATKDTHYDARVQPLFNGNRYYLFVYETFRDVRLVGTPPESIGKFGGDTDNWMWPRHTGDFAIFRIYCGPDGKPADYAEDNVPFRPKYHFPVSLNGYQDGDFAMILGFPGNTNRYKSSYGIEYVMNVTNPVRVEARAAKLDIIKEYMRTGQKPTIQYASKYARSSNYYKYSIGQNKGLKALDVIGKKKALEEKFTQWVNEDEDRKVNYGKALGLIERSYQNTEDEKAYEYLIEAMLRGPEIFYFSYGAKGLYEALKSGDNHERIEANKARMRAELDEYFKDYNAATDQKITAALLKLYAGNVDPSYHPRFFKEVKSKYKDDFEDFAEKVFSKTIFADAGKINAFLDDPKLKVLDKDPAFQAASDIFDQMTAIGEVMNKNAEDLQQGNRLFLAGLLEMDKERNFYPDANSTLRLTYGQVGGYVPRDAVSYDYFTTLKGYLEKEIPGDTEFDVPQRLKDLCAMNDFGDYADQDGSLHTCFISNNDITGGNSGSPVLNGKGQLIGIAFDGNWEAMSGDLAFEQELQKCISVDIRFVLWVIDKYAGATHLIDEMTIVK